MTTTLRPTGPERTDGHGGRQRGYAICVNGREVGGIRLQASPDGVGRIDELSVGERDRGRGRGTIAVLAAEEVLRSWGCSRVEGAFVGVEGPEVQRVLRWTENLGYALGSRNMTKALGSAPPELPTGLTARPLTPEEFSGWTAAQTVGYIEMLVRHSGRTPEQAASKAAADHAELFPRGLATPGASVSHLLAGDQVVGTIWVSTLATSEPEPCAWVYDVEVREGFRGRGYGRALMLLGERVTLAAGLRDLALNVHAGNVPAERLYASLGYRTFRWAVGKPL